ncbi:MAG: aminoglycoside phosphotransferase family protein [Lachnospiraceae bacterium]|nr:aminoglycoside phosphotransferase family protein [Lachnospiraceae bacterium]
MNTIIVYDNHIMPDVFIRNIVGEKTFGEIITKRVSIKDRFKKDLQAAGFDGELLEYDHSWELSQIKKRLKGAPGQAKILHLFSSCLCLPDGKEALRILYEKTGYAKENYLVRDDNKNILGFIMSDIDDYAEFLEMASDRLKEDETYKRYRFVFAEMLTGGFYDLSVYSNFQNYITGSFDTRFFNSVSGDDHVVRKTSHDKGKIKREYDFYGLLPDDMKPWFVMPYDYMETADSASYSMKRYHMADLALRWVHGAITPKEFDKLLEIIFYFLSHRARRQISAQEYNKTSEKLYLTKVRERVALLKQHRDYERLNTLSKTDGREYIDILMEKYEKLYGDLVNSTEFDHISVIGHGDLCFSNMLFDKNTELLMLIDPKGASDAEEMWTDPYYDLAKLSHSVCGMYDLFNYGLYRLDIDENLTCRLELESEGGEYEKKFAEALEKNGYDLKAVRVFEVSLFLSMLPLHMDNPKKVFAFMKNADRIMQEISR